jgi:hypothetical protein
MKRIPLTKGQFALVDDDDYEWIIQWKWCAYSSPTSGGCYYAGRRGKMSDGHRHSILMHREILGLKFGDRILGDHWNGDTLDNQRLNLRRSNHSQNASNSRLRVTNTSGFKGVSRFRKVWQAHIWINRKQIRLGLFDTAEAAYCEAAEKHHGEFGRTA